MKYLIWFFVLFTPLFAQSEQAGVQQPIGGLFFTDPYVVVERGIFNASKRHAIYTYIVSNMTTPEFNAVALLPEDDRAILRSVLPDGKYNKDVVLEFVMTRMSENNRKMTALMTLWKGKKDSLTRVVTLGK